MSPIAARPYLLPAFLSRRTSFFVTGMNFLIFQQHDALLEAQRGHARWRLTISAIDRKRLSVLVHHRRKTT
jgi:hypothetical protein